MESENPAKRVKLDANIQQKISPTSNVDDYISKSRKARMKGDILSAKTEIQTALSNWPTNVNLMVIFSPSIYLSMI
jgi:hypothetical protein